MRNSRTQICQLICLVAVLIAAPVHAQWTMAVLPDTQNYLINPPFRFEYLTSQLQWLVDSADEFGIELAVGTGDITARNSEADWETIAGFYSVLDGKIPYILPTGNHDYTPVRRAPIDADRDTTLLNDYFPTITHPDMVSKEPGKLENTYTRFIAPDGRKMLIFSLEITPRVEVTDWAATIANQYPDYTAVLATHLNMEEGPADAFGEPTSVREEDGNTLWNQWTGLQPNLELILSAHALDGNDTDPDGWAMTARQTSTGINGNRVTEIGFNTQNALPGGGNGWLRLYTFLEDGRTVRVRTYSPFFDSWLTNDRNDFTFTLTPIAGDFDGNDTVNGDDLSTWESSFGANTGADTDNDGDSDGADFLAWQRYFEGNTAPLSSPIVLVPEPSAIALGAWGGLFVFWRSRRGHHALASR